MRGWAVAATLLALSAWAIPDPLSLTIREAVPPGVTVLRIERTLTGARVIGSAARDVDVAAFMKALGTLAHVNGAMARVVGFGPGTVRLAMPGSDAGHVVELPEKDVGTWAVTLTHSEKLKQGGGLAFDLRMTSK